MTETTIIPHSFETWHHCITVECRIKLSAQYIKDRIASLQNPNDFRTEQFVRLYGDTHRKNVLGWFKQAEKSYQT